MTITVDVCWMDHVEEWFDRNVENIIHGIGISVLLASIPALVVSILMFTDNMPSVHEDASGGILLLFDHMVTLGAFIFGAIGTIILTYWIVSTLYDLNGKKHWFKIKHCEVEK